MTCSILFIIDKDYVLITSVVSFRPGSEFLSEFVILLLNDMLHEGDEVFKLGIRVHRQDGVFRDIPFRLSATFAVTIKDNDSKLPHCNWTEYTIS